MTPKISVVLPIYNQAGQIEYLFEQYTTRLPQLGVTWEVLFVVNGSKDESYAKVSELAKQNSNVKVFNLELGGWGRAVKFGIANASGELICYTNSARTTMDDLQLILTYALATEGMVLKTTRVIRESFVRKMGSILYNYENRTLLGTPIWDVNGTPKVFASKLIKSLDLVSDGDLIDAEVMAKVYRKDVQIVEVLIVSTKRIGGDKSTTTFKSAWKMYTGLLNLKKIV
jgi:glycosyltransferase involved in cell wall biosynthesis